MTDTRETRLVETFVTLTDNLVADYDVIDVLQTLVDRSVELFDAAAGAIHLLNRDGVLEVAASTSERSGFIGLLQLNAGEGPCITAVTTGSWSRRTTSSRCQHAGHGSRLLRRTTATAVSTPYHCGCATRSSGR